MPFPFRKLELKSPLQRNLPVSVTLHPTDAGYKTTAKKMPVFRSVVTNFFQVTKFFQSLDPKCSNRNSLFRSCFVDKIQSREHSVGFDQ
jgi:hypothetical protein